MINQIDTFRLSFIFHLKGVRLLNTQIVNQTFFNQAVMQLVSQLRSSLSASVSIGNTVLASLDHSSTEVN